jgi:hypothetical protein
MMDCRGQVAGYRGQGVVGRTAGYSLFPIPYSLR